MIIISQDKTKIINFEKTASVYCNSNVIFARVDIAEDILLGEYNTKEKAQVVLQEIIGFWEMAKNLAFVMPEE